MLNLFIDGLRQNGSLQRVAMPPIYDDSDAPVYNVRETRLIQAYCKRNEATPTLFADHWHGNDTTDNNRVDLKLFPMLFSAAKQAPITAPNTMLIGLLAAGDSIGPRQDRKRPRPGPKL